MYAYAKFNLILYFTQNHTIYTTKSKNLAARLGLQYAWYVNSMAQNLRSMNFARTKHQGHCFTTVRSYQY